MSSSPETIKAIAPLKVFCSYSHKDEAALDTLRKHLSSLHLSGLIEDWYDRKIPPGGDWDAAIRNNLDAADLILLLVSADFLHSEYCMQKETARALQWHEAGEATVIPVFLRECVISGLPFESIQGTPRDVKWINQQRFPDKAWTEVAQAVQAAALSRLRGSTWLGNVSQLDAWSTAVGQESVAQESTAPVDYGVIQTAFSGVNSRSQGSPSSQSGHAYVATGDDVTGRISFVRTGLMSLAGLIVVLFATWFSWGQWFSERQPDDPPLVTVVATPLNNTHLRVAKSYLDQGEYQKAQDTCQSAPESQFKKECLALANLALKEVDDSKLYLAEIEGLNSAYSEVLLGEFRLADFDGENNHGTLQLAERHFAKALQLNADLASVYFGRGQIQHFQGNAKSSLPFYTQSLSMVPDNGRYALNLATAMADAGELESAEKQLRGILTVNGEVLLAHAELVEVLVNQKKFSEAQTGARALQTVLLLRGDQVICDPVNKAEWVVFQGDLPAFMSSWATAGRDSWDEKRLYLNYVISLAKVPLVELPEAGCDLQLDIQPIGMLG